jgi:hypothetical protein
MILYRSFESFSSDLLFTLHREPFANRALDIATPAEPSCNSNATMKVFSRPLQSCNSRFARHIVSRTFSQYSSFARHPSPSAHKWSHPPSSTTIADDEVANLASQPLHALSLADLVKYCFQNHPVH